MPLPLVAIAAEDNGLPLEARAAIVASCVRVSGEARCVEANDELAPAATYLAVVRVAGEGRLHVTLQRRDDQVALGTRDLIFAGASLGAEHWNSAGLVVAALMADAEPTLAARATPPAPAAGPVTALNEPARAPDDALWASADLAGVATPGFTFDPWRFGVETKFAFGARRSPFYPVLAARWSSASGQVRAQALSAALGLGARLIELEDVLTLRLELAAVTDTLVVSATTVAGLERTFDTRYGARLCVTSSLELASALRVLLGAEVSWLAERAALELDGKRLGAEPRYVPGFTAGLSVDL